MDVLQATQDGAHLKAHFREFRIALVDASFGPREERRHILLTMPGRKHRASTVVTCESDMDETNSPRHVMLL